MGSRQEVKRPQARSEGRSQGFLALIDDDGPVGHPEARSSGFKVSEIASLARRVDQQERSSMEGKALQALAESGFLGVFAGAPNLPLVTQVLALFIYLRTVCPADPA